MSVDVNNTDRSYLYGRLLAIYEEIERSTYDKTETRIPNAVKLKERFVKNPLHTLGILDKQIIPYMDKHSAENRDYYNGLMGTVTEMLNNPTNIPLSETYIFGYYQQLKDLKEKDLKEQEKMKHE